nr:hypothetical protein [Tanacetum cinerariifolium]
MVMVGLIPNEYLKIKLLILYAKSGDLVTAHTIFNNLVTPNVISWNAMIAGYVQKGLEETGLNLYYEMRQKGLKPDQFTFASVFRASATLAMLEEGSLPITLLILCYWALSREASPETLEGAIVRSRMTDGGFKPNNVTFLVVLSACNHGGLVEESQDYFNSMRKDYGIVPGEKHYAAMVDLLGRRERLDEAYEFVKNAPSKKNFDLETDNVGKHVVLSNAYATFGQWSSVAEIRSGLKELGMKKEPGYSMIEVQKKVRYFCMGHNMHEQTEQIYEMVKDMNYVLKDAGFYFDFKVDSI